MIENTPPVKGNMHPENPHRFGYDFDILTLKSPELKQYVTKIGEKDTIDFALPEAVKALNKALLQTYHNVGFWDIPEGYLCPAVPGRTDYLLYMADLLAVTNSGTIPIGNTVSVLDIGTGASCIYPLLGNSLFGWSFVGTDIDPKAIANCTTIIESNPHVGEVISLQQQVNNRFIFKDIVLPEDRFTFTMCNPPFHNSRENASKETLRKLKNLEGDAASGELVLNFGGQATELFCDGGELAFITQMIYESARYPMQCLWYSTLVSKAANLSTIDKTLNKVNPVQIKIIDMAQGQKISRIVAWTFLSEKQQNEWKF